MKKILAVIITMSLIYILLLGVNDLPHFGNSDNPSNNEVTQYYIEKTAQETGANNIVTGIILDYRAFDTFVEASVLFTASIAVMILLFKKEDNEVKKNAVYIENTILKTICTILIPCIQIFGIYLLVYGHISPGGGFSGGTILGVSLILYRILGMKNFTNEKLSYNNLIKFLCGSIILYGCMKGYSFITGGSHLNFPQPSTGIAGHILSGGFLLPLNIIVGIIVAITMYFFFNLFDRSEI